MAAHARCTLRIFERVPPGRLQAPLRGYGALLFGFSFFLALVVLRLLAAINA